MLCGTTSTELLFIVAVEMALVTAVTVVVGDLDDTVVVAAEFSLPELLLVVVVVVVVVVPLESTFKFARFGNPSNPLSS